MAQGSNRLTRGPRFFPTAAEEATALKVPLACSNDFATEMILNPSAELISHTSCKTG